jgi:hypothetical protein
VQINNSEILTPELPFLGFLLDLALVSFGFLPLQVTLERALPLFLPLMEKVSKHSLAFPPHGAWQHHLQR